LRSRSATDTLAAVGPHQSRFGITRLTNTTLLDQIGLPVYAAIRPGAQKGSLCVSSGKALNALEAKLGALCEAIELQLAQFAPARHESKSVTVAELESQFDLDVYDFGVLSRYLKKIDPVGDRLQVTPARDHCTGRTYLIPASLVFVPFAERPSFFSQSSNGLAAGNTHSEALLHAILELIERDTLSFARVTRMERLVSAIRDPDFNEIELRVRNAGLKMYVTECRNAFDLPMFICYLFDPGVAGTVSVARGQGLHFDRGIALFRAVTEAIQSRLTNIHGGRDDIVRRFVAYGGAAGLQELQECRKLEARLASDSGDVPFERVPTHDLHGTVDENLDSLVELVLREGFRNIFCCDLSDSAVPELKVVKVVIPGLEFYSRDFPRVGKRLLQAMLH
jgi:ribosomal protein S12 methylthiotransferase accessory factor